MRSASSAAPNPNSNQSLDAKPANRNSTGLVLGLNTVQWFIFLLANSVAMPIVIGSVFHLPLEEVASLMQRTFFIVGVSSLLQGALGHRYPIADGPAGSWVSVFVIMADMALQRGENLHDTLQIIEGGLLVTGALLFLLGVSGLFYRMLSLFTPLVTGSFLLLLAIQLSGVFLKGMLGLSGEAVRMDAGIAAVAIGVFAIVIVLSVKGKGWLRNYAVLIGIGLGWAAYAAFGLGRSGATDAASPSDSTASAPWFELPELFAWGPPHWNAGIVITGALFTLILVSNTIAAISAVSQVAPASPKATPKSIYNRGSIAGGVTHFLTASFSTMGLVPLPVSAGFIQLTGEKRRSPFLAACVLLALVALFPGLVHVLALLPGPVANAALFATFVQMVGISLQSILRDPLDQRRLTILGITLVFGAGLMFQPSTAFQALPASVQYICGNGLLIGTMLSIALEQLWKKRPA